MDKKEQRLKDFKGTVSDMKLSLYKKWCDAKSVEEREELHATYRGLSSLTFLFTKSINAKET